MIAKRFCVTKLFYVMMGLAGLAAPFANASADDQTGAAPANAKTDMKTDAAAHEMRSMPMTKDVISREALDSQNPQDDAEALKNVAGVSSANSQGSVVSSINIRGINANLYTNYRLNGALPIATVISTPSEDKERIEALKGANALMYGIASPAGIINLVTKRATDKDVNKFKLSGSSFGEASAAVDIGRKFGEHKQFGLRVNLAKTHIETGTEGANGHREFGSVAADWKATDRLGFKLDLEDYSKKVVEQGSVGVLKPVNGVIQVPMIPDPRVLISGPWALADVHTRNVLLGARYLLTDNWKVKVEAGRSNSERSRFTTRINSYNPVTGAGTASITTTRDQQYENTYLNAELMGKFATGFLKHDLALGVMSNERLANVPGTTTIKVPDNLYNPVALAAPPAPGAITYKPQDSKDTGIYTYDTISLGRSWKVLAGIRETNYRADDVIAGGAHVTSNNKSSSPALGLLYDIAPRTTVYASYMKGLEETGAAPLGTANENTILPPAVATQKEFGIRSSYFHGVSASMAYFMINRANPVIDAASNVFLIDGSNDFKGLEGTLSADINRWWTVNAAGQLMHAEENPNLDLALKGKTPENIPKFSGNISVVHHSPLIKGLSLRAGARYIGPRFIGAQEQGQIPGVTLFSVGAGYKTKISGHATAINLAVSNLANKRYWNSVATASYGTGMDRCVRLNVAMDF